MGSDRLFLDTVFVQALLNRRDQYHGTVQALLPRVRQAHEVWTTEAILIEIGNALGALDRRIAADFILQCYRTANMQVVSVDTPLLRDALTLYVSRQDKSWGLTDCISFTVMAQHGLHIAVTADDHFVQAGYRALMLNSDQ